MIEKSVLPNGLTILTESLPYLHSVSVGLFVEAGSQDENLAERGVSHFIEHMLFKGTKRHSAKEIAEIVDASGSRMNAYTSKEYTCFYVKALDEHLELSINILAEMLTESTFAKEMIDRERQVILEEIRMYQDSPEDMVHDLFAKSVLEDHPLGQSIVGLEETVAAFDQELILDYVNRMYVPNNMVFVVVGNVDHKKAKELIEKNLGGLNGSNIDKCLVKPEIKGGKLIQQKDIEQMHLVLGTDSLGRNDVRKYTLHLLDT
ncbi:MAG: pitrilysin family protein, partial [Bacillota bacterium]